MLLPDCKELLLLRNKPPRRHKSIMKNVQHKKHQQVGYALLLVVFLTSLLLIGAMAAAPSLRTERQREKEQEMIWRGKQYVRGIKLFYRKNGRFPTSLDDLTKPKMGSLRFMRQVYKDPMNSSDGSWRLIYVGPAGQLIGSLKPQQTFQMPGLTGAQQPGTPAGNSTNQTGSFGSGFGSSGNAPTPTNQPAQNQSGANPQGTPPTGQGTGAASADDGSTLPASALSSNDNPIMGGNIVGVGSKINKRSVIVYDKAKNYRLFEFVWNPSKDLANAMGQGTQIGTPTAPGQNPAGLGNGFGQPSSNPGTPPPQSPPAPTPNPQPQM
jgi:hypothetical protein